MYSMRLTFLGNPLDEGIGLGFAFKFAVHIWGLLRHGEFAGLLTFGVFLTMTRRSDRHCERGTSAAIPCSEALIVKVSSALIPSMGLPDWIRQTGLVTITCNCIATREYVPRIDG